MERQIPLDECSSSTMRPGRPAATPRRRRRGSMVMEAALVLPLLLMVVFGAVEFGYTFFVRHALQGAAREGARCGILADAKNSDVMAAVKDSLESSGLGKSKYTVSILDGQTGKPANVNSLPAGSSVAVEVQAPWNQYSIFLSGFGDWTRGNLTARTVMRREG